MLIPEKHHSTISISSGTIFRFLLILAFFAALYFVRDIALVVLTAIVIASSVEPIMHWLRKRRIPRVPGVILIYVVVIGLLAAFFYFFVPVILSETSGFLSSLDSINVSSALHGILPADAATLTDHFSLRDALESIRGAISGFSQGFLGSLSFIFGGVMSFLLILVLSFYFAVQEDGVADFLGVIVPIHHQKYVIDLWKRSQAKIGLWLQGQILLALLVGVLDYLGLTILGVKHALLLAVIAAIFEIIPVFGPILSAIPGIAVALSTGGVSLAFLVTGLYVIVQQFESQLIYPLVVNKIVGVSPVIVIIALLVGGQLAGFLGLLLSVPISAALMEYYSDLKKHKIAGMYKPE